MLVTPQQVYLKVSHKKKRKELVMDSKHEDVLLALDAIRVTLKKEFKFPLNLTKEYEIVYNYIKDADIIRRDRDILRQALTPTKPIIGKAYKQLIEGACYTCGCCHTRAIFSGYKHCPECGVLIDWSDDE